MTPSGGSKSRKTKRRHLMIRCRRPKCSKDRLKCECNTAANHAEVVIRAVHYIPAEVVHPADRGSEADFDAATELADRFGFTTMVAHPNDIAARCEQQSVSPASAKDGTSASKNVRRKPTARNRISKGQSAKHPAGGPTLVAVPINIEKSAAVLIQRKTVTLNANAEVAAEEVFRVNAATPGMVNAQVTIITPRIAGGGIRSP